jgi:hypothetical protein
VDAALALVAIAASVYVVVAPFLVTRYAPMTDLPFHAAQSSTLAHYLDPSFHQREQFTLHPLRVPYLSMYVVAALFMRVLPAAIAVKIAAVSMLALLPAGLAVLFRGMKKSPLLGLTGLGFVWCTLTHWGFLNFVGALGLFAMVVGLALLVVDRPTRLRRVLLAVALVLLFFTHVFRFPFAVAGVVGAAIVVAPATRRLRPIALPLVPALALFAVFWFSRTKALEGDMGPLSLHTERLREIPSLLFGAFHDPAEPAAVALMARALVVVAAVSALAFVAEGRLAHRRRREIAWGVGVTIVPLACALVFLALFLVLPMQIGVWWYVYPREATAAAFVALGALPDLPRARWLRAALVVGLAGAACVMGRVVVRNYEAFDRATADFQTITRAIPKAPKLLYLVFDHSGSTRNNTPFIHLPAYVQADKGGWLSFHFAVWGASPLAYRDPREPGAVVPPPVPNRWEWRPDLFDVRTRGKFFDWFLVRRRSSPDALFRADPTIERVEHVGTWWLYRRRAP